MIGVFDSGVGGLSVLGALRRQLPYASLHYIADAAYAPYGGRNAGVLVQRTSRIARRLIDVVQADMVVVACNTATTQTIHVLRDAWPGIPFVGVEPGVKPAAACTRNGRIGVLATQRTIDSVRLRDLLVRHAARCEIVLQACPGLADAIEQGDFDAPVLAGLMDRYCEPMLRADVDTVVLGCTHYPLVADRLRERLGAQVKLIDTAEAVAARARSLVPGPVGVSAWTPGLRLESTGDPHALARVAQQVLAHGACASRIEL